MTAQLLLHCLSFTHNALISVHSGGDRAWKGECFSGTDDVLFHVTFPYSYYKLMEQFTQKVKPSHHLLPTR